MTILQTLLAALVVGAAAALQSTASQAISDGYRVLKGLIQHKFSAVDVELLEKDPQSQKRRALLEEELEQAKVADDPEVLQAAQKLLDALAQEKSATAQAIAQVVGLDLAEIRAASLKLTDIIAQGDQSVTGVKVKGATIEGAFEISGVRAGHLPAAPPVSAPKPIKILFLAADPIASNRLRIDEEARAMDQALRLAEYRHFAISSHWAVRSEDLQQLLLRHQPDIVHFSGHSGSGAIQLHNAAGMPVAVPTTALRNLFQVLKENIRCVVLNACYSQSQAAAIAEVIDAVVGMSDAIRDEAARHFSAAFYGALGYGKSVAEAFQLGCNRIDLEDLDPAQIPVLLPSQVDPATIRFVDPKA
jgi:hypothetical protein